MDEQPRRKRSRKPTTGANVLAAAEGTGVAGRGRPSKYKPEYAAQARQLCLLGMTNKQLGEFFKVDEDTVREWACHVEDFFQALKDGRELADARVAVSLYRRAIGYTHPSEQIVTLKVDRDQEVVERVPIVKHYAPDTAAAFIWLKNRRRDQWNDRADDRGTLPPAEQAMLVQQAIRAALAVEKDDSDEN